MAKNRVTLIRNKYYDITEFPLLKAMRLIPKFGIEQRKCSVGLIDIELSLGNIIVTSSVCDDYTLKCWRDKKGNSEASINISTTELYNLYKDYYSALKKAGLIK